LQNHNRPTARLKIEVGTPPFSRIMAIWLLGLILPLLAGKMILTGLRIEYAESAKSSLIHNLSEELRKFYRECSIKSHISSNLDFIESNSGLPNRSSNLQPSDSSSFSQPKTIAKALLNSMQKTLKASPVILLCANQTEVEMITNEADFPWFPRPGQKAAGSLMKKIMMQKQSGSQKGPGNSNQSINTRLLQNFSSSISGSYFSMLDQQEEVEEAFLDKGTGDKIFSIKRFFTLPDGQCVFAYYAMFCESSFSVEKLVSEACKNAGPGVTRKIVWRPIKFSAFSLQKRSRISLFTPVPYELLRIGSHQRKDILRNIFRQGKFKNPAGSLFLQVSGQIVMEEYNRLHNIFSLSAIFFLFISSILIHAAIRQSALPIDIRGKLFLAIFAAVVLPASSFFYSAWHYIYQTISRQQTLKHHEIQQNLKLLELKMKSEDTYLAELLRKRVNHIATLSDEKAIEKELIELNRESIVGAALIRSDGLIIEKFDWSRVEASFPVERFKLSREVALATILKYFQLSNTDTSALEKGIGSIQGGRKIISIAGFLYPMDIENFISYEGLSYSTSKEEGSFRFLTFRFNSIVEGSKKQNYLIIVEDIKEVVAHIINRSTSETDFFRRELGHGEQTTCLVGTFDLAGSRLNYSQCWPAGYSFNSHENEALNALTSGISEFNKIFTHSNGFKTAVCGRKISGYPLIGISSLEFNQSRLLFENASLLIIGFPLYFLSIISLISTVVSPLFITSIDALIKASESLGKDHRVSIDNQIPNELAQVTSEFNRMEMAYHERRRLERFMSEEAIAAIRKESHDLTSFRSLRVEKTILFSHIRDFNALVKSLEPNMLINMLNQFFSSMEAPIKNYGGQIDKYIGDAIMAVFSSDGAEQAEKRAAKAALEMLQKLEEFNSGFIRKNGLQTIKIGIGISTGTVISGRIGSNDSRQDFTVIGDRVNFAARLESLTHKLPESGIFMDHATFVRCESSTIEEGEVIVKGKTFAEKIYRVITHG